MANYTNDCRMLSFWSWNGLMEEAEICEQIRQFAERGYGGFFIHARAGLQLPYMGEKWFAMCGVAIREAKKRKLEVWLYDENGWPSGFASGAVNGRGVDYQAKQLIFSDRPIDRPDDIALASYKKEGNAYRRCAVGDPSAELHCGYRLCSDYSDLLSPDVTDLFIASTHEVYYRHFGADFGTTVKGIFTDEPQLRAPVWSDFLAKAYRQHYGVDILDELWQLLNREEECSAFRYRYYKTVSELFSDNYIRKIADWCGQHGIVLTGHLPSEDGACFQIGQTGGVMPSYRYMQMPGIDYLGNRLLSPVLMKQASSVVHQTGRKYVLSESFGCAGWEFSFRDMMSVIGWQAVMGVNKICAHLSAYTIYGRRKRDYPAFYSYHEPWWDDFGAIARYAADLNGLLSECERTTQVAVLHPTQGIWSHYWPCWHDDTACASARATSAQFRNLVEHLNELQIDFDLLDDNMLEQMESRDGATGNAYVSYRLLIVPGMRSISKETLRRIKRHHAVGGRVIFIDRLPEMIEGRRAPVQEELDFYPIVICNTYGLLNKYFSKNPVEQSCRLLTADGTALAKGLVIFNGARTGEHICYAFNRTEQPLTTVVCMAGRRRLAVYDCLTGNTEGMETEFDGVNTYAVITVPPKAGILVRGGEKRADTTAFIPRAVLRVDGITVTPESDNALLLDTAAYRIDDGEYSEEAHIIEKIDEIYHAMDRGVKTLSVRYRFAADYIPPVLSAAIETVSDVVVTVNGRRVEPTDRWWLDKYIRLYEITDCAVCGENEIVLTYPVNVSDSYNNLCGKFESERNKFFYQLEPESVYLLGNFDVASSEPARLSPFRITFSENVRFRLIPPTDKTVGDLTRQGMWFYRGNLCYSFPFDYTPGGPVALRLTGLHATAARIEVNGSSVGLAIGTEAVTVTEYLKPGKNKISIVLLGHNRNLLGPHHHKKHSARIVGPSTFNGVQGWEDFVNPELDGKTVGGNEWSFVPFGCDGIELLEG